MYKKTSLFIFSILLLLHLNSCSNMDKPSKQTTTTSEKTTETSPDYEKFGISEESIPSLKAIPVGGVAPDFTASDQNGNTLQLSEMVKDSSVILVFYRGYWCPYCTKHLAAFVDELSAIQSKGAKVIAIAPEGSDNRAKTVKSTGLPISFISDSDNNIMKKYGVAFKVNEAYNNKFKNWQKGLLTISEANGQEEAYLPIPATYIIAKDGTVKWSHFDPNYANRSSVADIVNNL